MDVLRRNNVTIHGDGERTLMFAHGLGCDQTMWRLVAPRFTDDARVVLFDHMGAGGSDVGAYEREKYADLHGYAADVVEICETLGLRDVVFVGHSVSAMIGVLAAARRPELFAGLVLIGASPRFANDGDYVGGFAVQDLEELLELLEKNQLDWSGAIAPAVVDDAAWQAEWRESVCRVDPVIAKAFARATFLSDHRADCGRVAAPTLLIECSDDALAPPQVGAFVHAAIAGSRRVILKATGHSPHLTSPTAVVAAMRTFLDLPAATATAD